MANILDRIRDSRRDIDRGIGEALRYYGGPFGEKLSSAVQVADMFNPVSGIEASMAAAGRAAEPDRSALERIQAILESGTEAALALTPAAAARLLMRGSRTTARAADEAASGVTETLTGARVPGLEDGDGLEGIEAAVAADEVVPAPTPQAPGDQLTDEDWAELLDAGAVTLPEHSMAEPARFYSPTAKAASQLPQSMYGSLDEGIAALLSRGAKPEELRMLEQVLYDRTELGPEASLRIMRDTMEQAADEFSNLGLTQPRPVYFRSGEATRYGEETRYDDFFTPGGIEYQEVVLQAPDLLKATFPPEAFTHFRPSTGGVLSHYRSAFFPTSEPGVADAYHVGEVQSDLAQIRNKLFPTAEDEAKFKAQRDSDLYSLQKQMTDVTQQRNKFIDDWNDLLDQGYEQTSPEVQSAISVYLDLSNRLDSLDTQYKRLRATFRDDNIRSRFGSRAQFDEDYGSKIPYIGSTDKWVQMTLRQALVDAANSPARYMTLGTGEMAAAMTGGKEAGQTVFYDNILPKNLNKVLQRLARDAKIQVPRIEPRKIQTALGPKMVPSIQLTDELRQALAEVGVPTYRDGGLVEA